MIVVTATAMIVVVVLVVVLYLSRPVEFVGHTSTERSRRSHRTKNESANPIESHQQVTSKGWNLKSKVSSVLWFSGCSRRQR